MEREISRSKPIIKSRKWSKPNQGIMSGSKVRVSSEAIVQKDGHPNRSYFLFGLVCLPLCFKRDLFVDLVFEVCLSRLFRLAPSEALLTASAFVLFFFFIEAPCWWPLLDSFDDRSECREESSFWRALVCLLTCCLIKFRSWGGSAGGSKSNIILAAFVAWPSKWCVLRSLSCKSMSLRSWVKR